MSNTSSKVRQTALTAVLAAVVLLMAFTPLGYLRIGPVSITFLVIPVVIGGMTLGPVRGGFLGALFGATSFAQCFMGDPFGAALVALSPLATAMACFVPRILIGVVAGLAVTGKTFDFFSLLGLLGLVGMNIKNAVILVSRIEELRSEGMAGIDAVATAAADRFVPVVVASGTTVLGLLPLLFDSMFGSMAATIMGGLIVATLLTLGILPVVYSIFYNIHEKR